MIFNVIFKRETRTLQKGIDLILKNKDLKAYFFRKLTEKLVDRMVEKIAVAVDENDDLNRLSEVLEVEFLNYCNDAQRVENEDSDKKSKRRRPAVDSVNVGKQDDQV